jgi:hypothetical protein
MPDPAEPAERRPLVYSERLKLARAALAWCERHGANSHDPVNIITALESMGRLK